jgi:hypothetical protein
VQATVRDARGRALAGARYAFTAGDGELREGRLDDRGQLRLFAVARGAGRLRLPDDDKRVHSVLDGEDNPIVVERVVALALEGQAPVGEVILAAVDGSGGDGKAAAALLRFEDVSLSRRYLVRVQPMRGPAYVLIRPRALRPADLIDGEPPHVALRGVLATLVYADDPKKVVRDKHVRIDVGEGDAFVAARTDDDGRLYVGDKPKERLWLDGARGSYRVAWDEKPIDEQAAAGRSQVCLLEKGILAVRRIKVSLPIAVGFAALDHARAWLRRHDVRVDVDGEPVACGAYLRSPRELVVEFGIQPGKHEVVVSAQEHDHGAPLKPRRLVFFAREVTLQ